MINLQGKKILLGVTGSIAAYEAAVLVRQFIKAGAEVRVLMTPAATRFISPLTLSTLSRKEVFSEVSSDAGWNNHVELGLWADAMVIAPLTASTLAKLASGLADNMVVAVYLSARCPVFFAPAMDIDMWQHPATQANVRRMESYGNQLIPVGFGELASGLVGEGRMAEPEAIVEQLERFFADRQDLAGHRLLITAGTTLEPVDPVRYIGNRSSGQMGMDLAEAAAGRGAAVELILGPTHLEPPRHPNIKVVHVETARQMYDAAVEAFPACQVAILAAAVADYRPREAAPEKIKKKDGLQLELVENPDIAATLGSRKKAGQLVIGFALETTNEEENARGKLNRKKLDFIVLNSLRDAGAGFNSATNKISIIGPGNKMQKFELKSKKEVARDILDAVVRLLKS